MKTCTKCNVSKEKTEFYKKKAAKDGLKSWCKKCHKEDNRKRESKYNETRRKYSETHKEEYRSKKKNYYKKNKDKLLKEGKKWRQTFKGRLASYKRGAEKRNFIWELTDDEFNSFWNSKCHYCGEYIDGVGIDRMDSNIGYLKDNCVPCCTPCNTIKSSLNKEDFLNQVKKIYENKYRSK